MSPLKGKVIECDNASVDNDNDDIGDGGDNSCEELGLSLEKLNLGAKKKKLLVLGLGGLLCYRVLKFDTFNIPTSCLPHSCYGNHLVYKRPYCEEFIKFCLERFEVAIWSSSSERHMDKVLECIKKGLKRRLVFAWGQEKCTNTGLRSLKKKQKPLFMKELKKVWQNNNGMFPNCDGKFNPSNTLLIDDSPYKALANPVNNAIFLDEYEVDNAKENAFVPESELRRYLDKLVNANDVPSFVKENPFGQIPITPKHPQWNYYSKVFRTFQKPTRAVYVRTVKM